MGNGEIPGGKSVDWLFQEIAENNDQRATNAATEIIRTANDRELRSAMVKLVTEYQTAGDSVKMHDAMEAIIQYIKEQYALIGCQFFRMGQGYQQKIANAAFKDILEGAAKAAEAEGLKKGEEIQEEDATNEEPKSEN